MHFVKVILMSLLLCGVPVASRAAEAVTPEVPQVHSAPAETATATAAVHEEHGVSPKAMDVWHIGPLPISNSMVVTWIVAIGLIIFAQVATRNIQQIPSGAQNFWEWLVESLHNFLEGIIGHKLVQKTFLFFATIFIFILFSNWVGLIPGIDTIGRGVQTAHGFRVEEPLLRGANADLNMTLAMAVVFFACWIIWALQANGPIGFLKHLFAPKGESTGPLKVLL